MTALAARPLLTRFTLRTVLATTALGSVLIAFACGDNGTASTPPSTTPDLSTGDTADMATTGDLATAPGSLALTSVAPKLVSTAGGTVVTLTGANFGSGATVKVGTVTIAANNTTVSTDGKTITITVPARLGMAGKVDVTVTNPDSQSAALTGALTYYLGQSSFGTAKAVAADRGPRCIIVADMNNDKKLDLVTANFTGNSASIFLGDDQGGFANSVSRGTGTNPYTVAVADLDGDNNLDVVSANANVTMPTNGSLSVMTGDGKGNLNSPVANTAYLGNSPQSVVIFDVNMDGALDLVVNNFGNMNNNVSLLMGNKTTTFTSPGSTMITANGDKLYSLIVDDFNKDNKLDLIGVHQSTAAINVSPMINQGKGTTPFFTVGANKSGASTPTAAAAGDFDNDGNKDIAVVNQAGNSVSFLKGSATGTFTDTAANGITPVGTGPQHLAALDVNLDGNLDLVVANYTSGDVSLLLGKGDGTFATATTVNVGTGVKPNWVAVGDFNKDGRLDLAVTDFNTTAGRIMILLNTSQ